VEHSKRSTDDMHLSTRMIHVKLPSSTGERVLLDLAICWLKRELLWITNWFRRHRTLLLVGFINYQLLAEVRSPSGHREPWPGELDRRNLTPTSLPVQTSNTHRERARERQDIKKKARDHITMIGTRCQTEPFYTPKAVSLRLRRRPIKTTRGGEKPPCAVMARWEKLLLEGQRAAWSSPSPSSGVVWCDVASRADLVFAGAPREWTDLVVMYCLPG
jgi:hypothetical protein